MIVGSLLVILAVAYIVLKILNTKAKFDQADAEREAKEQEAKLAAEEAAEEAAVRAEAIDVDAETIRE